MDTKCGFKKDEFEDKPISAIDISSNSWTPISRVLTRPRMNDDMNSNHYPDDQKIAMDGDEELKVHLPCCLDFWFKICQFFCYGKGPKYSFHENFDNTQWIVMIVFSLILLGPLVSEILKSFRHQILDSSTNFSTLEL